LSTTPALLPPATEANAEAPPLPSAQPPRERPSWVLSTLLAGVLVLLLLVVAMLWTTT
jgi:hypothetical protein